MCGGKKNSCELPPEDQVNWNTEWPAVEEAESRKVPSLTEKWSTYYVRLKVYFFLCNHHSFHKQVRKAARDPRMNGKRTSFQSSTHTNVCGVQERSRWYACSRWSCRGNFFRSRYSVSCAVLRSGLKSKQSKFSCTATQSYPHLPRKHTLKYLKS